MSGLVEKIGEWENLADRSEANALEAWQDGAFERASLLSNAALRQELRALRYVLMECLGPTIQTVDTTLPPLGDLS